MDVSCEQAQELILAAVDEELHGIIFRGILFDGDGEGLSVDGFHQLVDIRTNIFAFVLQVDLGGGAVTVQSVELFQAVGSQEIAEQGAKVQNAQNGHGNASQLVLLQLAAHQSPLGLLDYLFVLQHQLL